MRPDLANPSRHRARLVSCPNAAASQHGPHNARLSQRLDDGAWVSRVECRRCGYRAESVDAGTAERTRRQAAAALCASA